MTRKVYVTGADRGLGLGLTEIFLEQGYKVYAGTFLPECEEIKELLRKYGDHLMVVPLDVTCDESVERAAALIAADTDHLHVLVNNAGTARDKSGTIFEKQYMDDIRMMFEVNTFGPLRVTQSVLSLLLKGEPKTLVNISSLAGSVSSVTRVNQYGYTMSKAALNMQSKLIHNHLKDLGLKVLLLHPGWMRSHIFGDISRMKDAPLEPIESARAIVERIHSSTNHGEEIFIDYQGNNIPW
jgi:NAD(P)-dependent dehydrogenase (short-subunit alcohol dehydrogenase family)